MIIEEPYRSNNKSLNREFIVLTTNSIDLIISKLTDNDQEVVEILDKFINFGIRLIQDTGELQEEIHEFEELFQFHITDLNFIFWINVSKGKITYEKGFNANASIRISVTKDLLLKIFKGEISITEAYMKGLMNVHGSLSQAFKVKNFLRLLMDYLKINSKSNSKSNE